MSSPTLRDLAIGCVAISWAAIFFRLADGVDPLLASALRLGLAALLLSPAIVRARRGGRLGPRALRAAAIGGALYAIHFGTWVASLGMTTVAASVTLVTASPIFLALVGALRRRDAPGRAQLAAIAITTLGVVIIGGSDARLDADALAGDALALVGAVAMGGYLLVARELGDELEPIAFSGTCAAIGSAILGLATIGTGAIATVGSIAPLDLLWIALAALVPQVIGHSLLTRALRGASPTVVGLATCSEPVLSTLLAIPVLSETPPPIVVLGCAVTLGGVILGARG